MLGTGMARCDLAATHCCQTAIPDQPRLIAISVEREHEETHTSCSSGLNILGFCCPGVFAQSVCVVVLWLRLHIYCVAHRRHCVKYDAVLPCLSCSPPRRICHARIAAEPSKYSFWNQDEGGILGIPGRCSLPETWLVLLKKDVTKTEESSCYKFAACFSQCRNWKTPRCIALLD